MKLDNTAKAAAAISAIITLCVSLGYAGFTMWVLVHAQFAQASTVNYLIEKQIKVDIWQYEDELERLQKKIENEEQGTADYQKLLRRIEKLENRLDHLEDKLDDLEMEQ